MKYRVHLVYNLNQNRIIEITSVDARHAGCDACRVLSYELDIPYCMIGYSEVEVIC